MNRPVWFLNFCVSIDGGRDLTALMEWAPVIHGWLDGTRIRGHEHWEKTCLATLKLYRRFAHFEKLRGGDNGSLGPVVNLCVRLAGLA